jgi:hypothetical protein
MCFNVFLYGKTHVSYILHIKKTPSLKPCFHCLLMLAVCYVRLWVACLNLAYVQNSNSFAVFEIEVWTTDTADLAFCSSFENDLSSVAIEQRSAEDVLAAGMLVADVLVLADDCTRYKCCVICSLTSYEKIRTHRSRKYRKIMHKHKLLTLLQKQQTKLFCCL